MPYTSRELDAMERDAARQAGTMQYRCPRAWARGKQISALLDALTLEPPTLGRSRRWADLIAARVEVDEALISGIDLPEDPEE